MGVEKRNKKRKSKEDGEDSEARLGERRNKGEGDVEKERKRGEG